MRVTHVAAYFAPAYQYGGPPRSMLGLCKGLQAAGVETTVVTTTAAGTNELPPSPAGLDFEGVRVRRLPLGTPRRFFAVRGLKAVLAEEFRHADVLHVHGLWNLTVWQAMAAARKARMPYVISPRGMMDPGSLARQRLLKRAAYPLVERKNLAAASRLHATSAAEEANLRAAGFARVEM